ncbi:MAG: hypothetical protein J5882_07280 [Bacteroidales bacterium]|nr:hypothetical protein [Bacteroidales bacterium]
MTKQTIIPPPVLAAQTKQKYHKPSFEVINIDMESPLLAGSATPTNKKSPLNPIGNGGNW